MQDSLSLSVDERRRRVAKALEARSPRLAGMHRSTLSILRSEPEAGCEVARVSMICHCMRELMLNVPAVIADSIIPRIDPSSTTLVARLPGLLARHSDVDLDIDQDMIPIPKAVAQEFALLVKTRTQEDGRNRSNAAALLTGGSDSTHPVINEWKKAYDFFVGWAHLDRNHERGGKLPDDEELLAVIGVVEDVIDVRTRVFFENLHALDDLLAAANTVYPEGS